MEIPNNKEPWLVKNYSTYLFNCHCQGDIWNETYRPYTVEEWSELGCPMDGGVML